MKKKYYNYDDIELTYLFKILWRKKILILVTTIISSLIGHAYVSKIEKNYQYSIIINQSKSHKLNNFDLLDRMLSPEIPGNIKKNVIQKQVSQVILKRFIREIQDKDEIIVNLKNLKEIRQDINNLSSENEKAKLYNYSNLVEIVNIEDSNNFKINFKWNNRDEAKKFFQDTIELTIENLKNRVFAELENALEIQKKIILYSDIQRLNYLTEQSAIAKELKIEDNQVKNLNLSQSSVQLTINPTNVAYYLRGSKAIDKEIELINQRKYKNLNFIKSEIDYLKNTNFKWVEYNLFLIKGKLLNDTSSYSIISILIGLASGILYALISHMVLSQVTSKKRA